MINSIQTKIIHFTYLLTKFLIVLTITTSCTNNILCNANRKKDISGRIENKIYMTPQYLFSIKIPKECRRGGLVEDDFKCEINSNNESLATGFVRFIGKPGMYSGIEENYDIYFLEMPKVAVSKINQNSESREQGLRDFLSMVIFGSLKELASQAEILSSDIISIPGAETALFAVIDLPDLQTKYIRGDMSASAGTLITMFDNTLIAFTTIRTFHNSVALEGKSRVLKDEIMELYSTFSWNKCNTTSPTYIIETGL